MSTPHPHFTARLAAWPMLALPGAALACESVAQAGGTAVNEGMHWGGPLAGLFVAALVLVAALGVLAALSLGAQKIWKAVFKTQPPFGFLSFSAFLTALLLGAFGLYVLSAFEKLFDSFGADLPAATLMLLHYRHLLLAPAIVLLALLYKLRTHPRREQYFAAILAGEGLLLVMCVVALYLPIFKVGEAVSA